jgi:hypothetical protein
MKIGRFDINPRRILVFAGVVIVLAIVMNFNARVEELVRLQEQAATVRAQATAVMVTQLALQTQVAYATSPGVIAEWAREEERMAQPGDHVVIPLPMPGVTPPPTPAPPAPYENLTKWDVWMVLFFGQ